MYARNRQIMIQSTAFCNGQVISWWFLRGLGLVYLAAFGSMATQIEGLIGSNGILPVQAQLDRMAFAYQDAKYLYFPTIFWLDASDTALHAVCLGGIAAAAMVIAEVFIVPALLTCYVLYLSITTAGQDFTGFQWDVYLLECGFLAIFLAGHSKIVHCLYRLLIARFMFMGGVVKIASGDPTWADLTALSYHYQTQPLPSPLGYYAHFLPGWWQQLCTAGVLIIELTAPFLVLFPRPFRLIAAWSFLVLQLGIVLTGNYTFFNLLTMLLCLFLFDDSDLEKITPATHFASLQQRRYVATPLTNWCAGLWGFCVVLILATHVWIAQTHRPPALLLRRLLEIASEFSVVNNYGPFAVMTTKRHELIVEGSNDGEHWLEYGFKYKPGAPDKPLSWNIPHQPRLDWQLWFAALSPPESLAWFGNFMQRLKTGAPAVLSLLAENPFPNAPPAHLRALLYRYTFLTPEEHSATGLVWHREKLGIYYADDPRLPKQY